MPARVVAAPETEETAAPADDEAASPVAPGQSPSAGPPIAGGVQTDDKIFDQFDQHWNEGRRLFGRREYARAAIEFERAYAAVPASDALYNVVISFAEDGDEVAAADAAQRYLALAPCGGDADPIRCASRVDEVRTTFADLRARVVELALDVSAGVTLREIRINGRIVSAKRFPIFVEPGTVQIELVGTEPGQRVVREPKLRPGEQYVVQATPFRAVIERKNLDPNTGGVPPPRRERNTKALKAAFWSGVGLTAASLASMATLAGLTPWAKREFERKNGMENQGCDANATMQPACKDPFPSKEQTRYQRVQLSTNVLIGVTAGLATITTIVGIFAFSQQRKPSANQRASTRVRVRPAGAGVTLSF
ncbi:MAG TPA: hypothetical protein VFG69_16820 [Nannocystaceae bacterium]|nr:hypothetical protein [Nannocystaceae bacterium]